jgi:Ca-activated chloride channel family protein
MTPAPSLWPAAVQTTVLGLRLRIADPLWLWLAPVALLVGAWAAGVAVRRHSRAARLLPQPRRAQLLPELSGTQGALRSSALGLGLSLLFVAAAGPQCGERTEIVKRAGVDLVIALDASTSMLARDVKPSRLERAKVEVSALLDQLKGDRVGLVVFAGEAFVQCPLTTDYGAAKLFLRAVDPHNMPQQGTAIAEALDEARRVLDGGSRGGAGKAVLLLTDGEDFEGDAAQVAAQLAEAGIRVYAAPVGTEAGEPIPLTDAQGNVTGYKKDREGKTVLTRVDVNALREVAEKGGGKLLAGSAMGVGVSQLVAELDKMQKGELESRLTVQYDERYGALAWPAFALLAVGAALGEGRFRLWRKR